MYKKNIAESFTAVLSAACIAVSAGCSATIGEGTRTAMSVDGYDIPAGIFVYYSVQAYDEAVSLLTEQNESGETPTVKDVKGAKIDEIDSADWIQNKATEECVTYAAIQKKFDEVGASLSPEDQDEIDSMAEYYSAYDARNELNGVSTESIRKIAEASFKQKEIFEYYYGIGGEKGVTDEEMKNYFDENYARVKYISVSLVDSEGNPLDEDAQRERRKLAESYAAQINKKSGTLDKMLEVDEVSKEYDEYISAQSTTEALEGVTIQTTTTAAVTTEAEGTTETTTTDPYANERLYQKRTTAAESEEESTETTAESDATKAYNAFNDYIFDSLTLNKAEVYDYDDETLYVVIRGDLRERMTEDGYWTEDYIYQLLQERYFEEYQKMIEDYAAEMTPEKNNSAYRRYAPFKLELEQKQNQNQ